MKPTAKVIAYTKFLGVPDELMPKCGITQIIQSSQDYGSDLARLTECAGRTCYDSYGKGRSSEAYHQHILEVGHGSVLEHASISFYLSGLSRGCTHELVRHRVGTAISQRSTRYVDESESEWCWHPLIADALQEKQVGPTCLDLCQSSCRNAYSAVVELVQAYLEAKGTDRLAARKQARGAARGVLGNALETALVWTANLRALRNVIEQRASVHADAEIRLLANALLDAAWPVCPEYLCDYTRDDCPDGIGYAVSTDYRKV
jgi:thymidylate synthase (FAD)